MDRAVRQRQEQALLYIIGTLERPSAGSVRVDGRDVSELGEAALAEFRNRETGFVFQDHFLLPQLSVLENVLAPTLVAREAGAYEERARALLERVGLADRSCHPAGGVVGRRAPARGARARARVRARGRVRRAHRGTSTPIRRAAVADLILELHRAERAPGAGDAQRRARRAAAAAPAHEPGDASNPP